jgi:hypothetical protein
MNCKKGDLAVIVGSIYKDKFVRCVSFVGDPVGYYSTSGKSDFWEIDRKLSLTHSGLISDSVLRPIRDNLGNEHWVTEARKSLPSTGPRITERGEIE